MSGDSVPVKSLTESGTLPEGPRRTAYWLDVARHLLLENPDIRPWDDLLVNVGKTLARAGRLDLSRAVFRDVADLWHPVALSGASAVQVEATRWRAQLDVLAGRYREACSMLITQLAETPDPEGAGAAALRVTLASVGLQSGSPDLMWAREAVDAAIRHGATLQAHALAVFAVAAGVRGDLDSATPALTRAAALLDAEAGAESASDCVQTLIWLGLGTAMVERYRDALSHFADALTLVHATRDELWTIHVLVGLSAAYCCLGRLVEAATHAAVAIEHANTLGCGALQELAYAAQARAAVH
jgi:hypothetical protein